MISSHSDRLWQLVIYQLHEQVIQVYEDEITSFIFQAISLTERFSQKLRNENISQAPWTNKVEQNGEFISEIIHTLGTGQV